MTDIKRVGDAGVYTQEGNLAGARAARLNKQREKDKAAYEAAKNKIKETNALGKIDDKFASSSADALEQEFRRQTVGLKSAEDFRKAKDVIDAAKTEHEKRVMKEKAATDEKKKLEREKKRKQMEASLSFAGDDEEQEEEVFVPKKATKNPSAETDFLPDRHRDEQMQREKERLTAEWLEEQKLIKEEMLEVTYSFWDGSGHRKTLQVTKGTTIGKFLINVKRQLEPDFPEVHA